MTLEQVLGELFARVGLREVSVTVLALLVSVIIWSSRARHAGHIAGRTVGTARSVAVVLALLTVAGVITFDLQRAGSLAGWLADIAPQFYRFLEGLA